MKHPNASKLPYDIPYLLGSDLHVNLKLIDGRDNLTLAEIQKIKVTHETAGAIEFCLVTFPSNKN